MPHTKPGQETNLTVLVAGNRGFPRLCAATLKDAGIPVRRSRNWAQALTHLEDEEVALLILDPRLKGMGLLEGLRLTRKMNPALLVLVLGPLAPEFQPEALRAGAEGVLPDDLPPPALVDWVRSYGHRQRLRRENLGLRTRILESEAYLARILDHMDEGIITTDVGGRPLAANQAARQLCRLPPGPLSARALKEVAVKGPGLHNLAEAAARVIAAGSFEERVLLSQESGAPFPIYFRGSIHRLEGGEVETILVLRDLSAQEELELRVEESERLAALGQIAAGMAHEIRNPLMAVGGLIRRLERHLPAENPGYGYLPGIRENVRRMEGMVREIDEYLHYVRASKDQLTELKLADVLDAALARLQADSNLSSFLLDAGPPPRVNVRGDWNSLTEMFFQILRNAAEAMPEGGILGVRSFVEAGKAVVQVSDNGRGISPEHFSSIYHPFFTTKMAGPGMGLTKVYMIAQRHQALIEADSRPQQGTTFTVRLPLA
jgi:two-component system sensor histidine kinase HydH